MPAREKPGTATGLAETTQQGNPRDALCIMLCLLSYADGAFQVHMISCSSNVGLAAVVRSRLRDVNNLHGSDVGTYGFGNLASRLQQLSPTCIPCSGILCRTVDIDLPLSVDLSKDHHLSLRGGWRGPATDVRWPRGFRQSLPFTRQ